MIDHQSDASTQTSFEPGEPFRVKRLSLAKEQEIKDGAGRRSKTVSSDKRGRYTRSALSTKERINDLAFDATFRAAAPHQIKRSQELEIKSQGLIIKTQDMRKKVREKKIGNLMLFVVDSSGSMGANQRMVAAKGAILSLLIDAYEKRDRVGMIAFKGERAEILLPPTNSLELASKQLSELPTGGKTPLSSGLQVCLELIQKELRKNQQLAILIVLITDGRANVSLLKGANPFEEAKAIALQIKEIGAKSIVIDTESGFIRFKKTEAIAQCLGGRCFSMEDIKAETIYELVKQRGET
ncbi:MAG: VWA domain-containing protein [bacterium]